MVTKHIPLNLKGTTVEPIWQEVEAIAHGQGFDPGRGAPVVIADPEPKFKRDIETLEACGGCRVTNRGDGTYGVTLNYEDEDVKLISLPGYRLMVKCGYPGVDPDMKFNWFSDYHYSDWTPEKGYNGEFRQIIEQLREWFGLSSVE